MRRWPVACGDDGAAVLWSVALVFVLTLAGLVSLAVAQQALARQHAEAAADVAALAGAQADGDPCSAAQQASAANGTSLVACALDDGDVVVRVSSPPPPLVRRLFALMGEDPNDVLAVARAGPPD